MKTYVVTVETTPTLLTDWTKDTYTPGESGGDMAHFAATATFYNGSTGFSVGGSDVSVANGLPIVAGAYPSFELYRGENVYGIVASGTVDVRVCLTGA